MPSWNSLMFQDMGSFSMMELSSLHDYVMIFMLMIIVLILYIMAYLLSMNFYYKFLSEGTLIETIWSILPAFLLIFLVMPSMGVLYNMENVSSPAFSVKIVGHQWYWTYIVPFFNNVSYSFMGNSYESYEFDSILNDNSSNNNFPRLLDVSNTLILPLNVTTRFIITSVDVIHSFAVPSLSLKVDALPGRINQLYSLPFRMGLFFGQCSEICGSNHSFMPISILVSNFSFFDNVSQSYLFNSILDEPFYVENLLT